MGCWSNAKNGVLSKTRRSSPRLVLALMLLLVDASVARLAAPSTVAATWGPTITVSFYSDATHGDGKGRVTSDDGGIDCAYDGGTASGDCSEHYIVADFLASLDVVLTITPATGSYECLSGALLCDFSGSPHTFPMHFDRGTGGDGSFTPSLNLRPFEVHIDAQGPGRVTGNGAFCPVGGNVDYCGVFKYGKQATLTATPDSGYPFNGWDSGPCATQGATCTFTVTGAYTTIAFFGRYYLTLRPSTGGTVCSMLPDLECVAVGLGGALRFSLLKGTSVTATAEPDYGYRFDHWSSGPCSGKPASCTFTMLADTELLATFTRLATPAPAATARPTSTAGPPRPSSTTATSSRSPSAAPGSTPVAASGGPDQTPKPTGTSAPTQPAPSALGSVAELPDESRSASPSSPPLAADDRERDPSQPWLLAAALLVVLLAVVAGFALGRRGSGSPRTRA